MKKKFWTDEERDSLSKLFPSMATAEIVKILNRSTSSVNTQAFLMGLKKDESYLSAMRGILIQELTEKGKIHRFVKGQTSINKGKKWNEYMPEESQEQSRRTCFKKGNIPHCAIPDGGTVIRQRKDRNERPYIMVKVPGERKLKHLHVHTWEQAHGPIPKRYNIVFKDGNTMNCELSNLEIISNAELMLRNTMHRYPPEVVSLIQTKGVLNRKINQIKQKTKWQTQE